MFPQSEAINLATHEYQSGVGTSNEPRQGFRSQSSQLLSGAEQENRDLPDALSRLVWTLLHAGGVSVRLIDPRIKDPISQLIVEAVLTRGPLTVSGIARYVKQA